MGKQKERQANRRRRYSTTDEQDALLLAESERRGVPSREVFREVVGEGFRAHFGKTVDADVVNERLEELARSVQAARDEIKQEGKACLASSAWSDYAMFGILRWLLMCEGQNVDNPGVTYCGMSRALSETDCGTISGIWESAGKRMAAGGGFAESLADACRERGISWFEFSGTSAGTAQQEPPNKEKAKQKGRRKNGGKR